MKLSRQAALFTPQDIQEEHRQLSGYLRHLAKKYYQDDEPEVDDDVYDQLYQRLLALEEKFPALKQQDSPSARVGAEPKRPFAKVAHLAPMLSLDNAFSEEDIRAFLTRLRRFLFQNATSSPIEIVIEPKIDGLSVALLYKQGKLVSAATRGNGRIGEDITRNVHTIQAIPQYVSGLVGIDCIEVRGEIFMR
ncbi:MAG: hypothetical protein LBQ26_02150, partial [Holosporales bacterium]|nr:hypothetical protein [Holosporales bacterium]